MSDTGKKAGFAALLDVVAEDQDEMIETSATDMELFGEPVVEKRGRGRPKGAVNQATKDQVAHCRRMGMSPLRFLQIIWSDEKHKIDDRIRAASAALPYLHAKLPVAVDLGDQGLISLTIEAPKPASGQLPGDNATLIEAQIIGQGNQQVTDGQSGELDSAKLDKTRKALENKAENALEPLTKDQPERPGSSAGQAAADPVLPAIEETDT